MATTEDRFDRDRDRLAQGLSFDVHMPYGPVDWTVRELHGFWDSWLHERDVLLARGTVHPADGDATGYATGSGLFIAAAVASMSDALAGRAPVASVLGDLPADSRAVLSGLGTFFNSPVEPNPAS